MSSSSLGYTKEQADAIKQLKQGKDNFERLGIRFGASRQVFCYCLCMVFDDKISAQHAPPSHISIP